MHGSYQLDAYSPYETGLHRLLHQLGRDHPRYAEGLVYQHRLSENIAQSRRYGDTEVRKAERFEIIDRLNELALSTVRASFTELCNLATPVTQPELASPLLTKLDSVRLAAERLLADFDDLCNEIYGIRHIRQTVEYLQRLVLSPARLNPPLSEPEYFVLLAASYLHSVGLQRLPRQDCVSLSREHLYELSYQAIIDRAKSPSGIMELGLEPQDPILEIAQVIQAQATWPPVIREVSAVDGQGVRLHLLAALLRLALSLDVGGAAASPTDDPKLPPELRLQHWLRRYVKAVVIQDGLVRLYYEAPAEDYGLILKALVSGPVLRCCRQVMTILWNYGLNVSLAPSQVDVSPLRPPLPPDLWRLATAPDYLGKALQIPVDVLGETRPVEIPFLYPYYFGAIRTLDRFEWQPNLPAADNLQYEIRVDDIAAQENKLKIVTTALPYLPGPLPLEPGRRYRWRITARREQVRVGAARGDFWLLTEEEHRALVEAENRAEQANSQEATFAKGMLYASARLYGEAVATFEMLRAQAQAAAQRIYPHLALAETFEMLYQELRALERFDDADHFLNMANAHFSSLKQTILEEMGGQVRSP